MSVELAVFVVPTAKLADSLTFYRDGIGLEVVEEWVEMGRGALLAASEACQIELVEMEDVQESTEPCVTIGLKVAVVDEVYGRLKALGARTKASPRVMPWGMYGFGAFDPNGVPVNIYEPAESRPYRAEGA